jgi:hypothetical protein
LPAISAITTTVTAVSTLSVIVATTFGAASSPALVVLVGFFSTTSSLLLVIAVAAFLRLAHELVAGAVFNHTVRLIGLSGRVASALWIFLIPLPSINLSRLILFVREDDIALDRSLNSFGVLAHDLRQSLALSLSLDQTRNVQLLSSNSASFHKDSLDSASLPTAALQVTANAIAAADLAAVQNLVILSEDLVVESASRVVSEAGNTLFAARTASARLSFVIITLSFNCGFLSLGCRVELRNEIVLKLLVDEAAHNHRENEVEHDGETTEHCKVHPERVQSSVRDLLELVAFLDRHSGDDLLAEHLNHFVLRLFELVQINILFSSIVEWHEEVFAFEKLAHIEGVNALYRHHRLDGHMDDASALFIGLFKAGGVHDNLVIHHNDMLALEQVLG